MSRTQVVPDAWRVPLAVFVVLWLHGATLGISDDEAYYWALSREIQGAYAFHPPAVAWILRAISELLGGWAHPAVVRLPAAFGAAWIVWLGSAWMRSAGMSQGRTIAGAAVLVAFGGLFGSAWMMVPDIPLLMGWSLLFWASYQARGALLALVIGAALVLLSKYSGIVAVASAAVAIACSTDRGRRGERWLALLVGCIVGCAPVLLEFAERGAGSLYYQVQGRHGGDWSFIRWIRFVLLQLLFAGPVLLVFTLKALWPSRLGLSDAPTRHFMIWSLPVAIIYGLQPLIGDFKPHWAFIVWLPGAMLMGLKWTQGELDRRAMKLHYAWGASVIVMVLLVSRFPVVSWLKPGIDPRMDLANDLRGWSEFADWYRAQPESIRVLPISASRYQTASQAAFALNDRSRSKVELLPRQGPESSEWADLGIGWPRLLRSTLFVADHRYNAGPGFSSAACMQLTRVSSRAFGRPSRWIDVWRCEPSHPSESPG